MLNFIFGRPGSGKTTYVIDRIRKSVAEGKQTYLIVPEQQAFISESMLADLPASSALCFSVISFSRLCTIVSEICGGLTDVAAEGGVRSLVMWQTLREISGELYEYSAVKADPAFGQMMLSTIDELRVSGFSAERCEETAEACSDEALSRKLRDVALVYAEFSRRMELRVGEGALAAEDRLARLASILRENKLFSDCRFFVDSFTSFTGVEHAVLGELAKQSEELSITLCRDKTMKNMPHTASIDDTYIRLKTFANKNGIDTSSVSLSVGDGEKNKHIAALERGLWDFSLTPDTLPVNNKRAPKSIEAFVCKNDFDEINLAALKILQAYRSGTRFSEIAVIVRDAESRKGIIEAVFSRMGIPYFLSERTDLSSSAAARLIFSALRCVIYNFRSADVLTLLKTGLCGIDEKDADLFEDYCYTWSINGSRFLDEAWSMNPDGYTADPPGERGNAILLSANRVRRTLIEPLVALKTRFAAARGNTLENCRAIYQYLGDVGLEASLASLAKASVKDNEIREAGESLRIYDSIIKALSQVATVLSDTVTTPQELSEAIEIMLRGSDIGSVPEVGDYVTVGSAPTIRVENVSLAIVLGLCEGEFPRNFSDSGIFTEQDKAKLEELKLPLTSRETRVTSDELFYVYRALTKPRDRLIISTYSSKVGGGSVSPSTAWNRISFLFPNLKVFAFDLDLIKLIADAMSEGKRTDGQLRRAISDKEKATDLSADTVEINPMQVKMLFKDNTLHLSQTKISTFASCPYQFWCKYVLSLRERKISAVSYDNSGTVVHYVLEKLIGKLKRQEDNSIEIPDDDVLIELVNGFVEKYLSDIGCPLSPSTMYTFSRLRDLSLIMAKSVLDEFASSRFKVLAQELRISETRGNALRPIEIRLEEGDESSPRIILGGIIDRIDYYDGEDKRYIRVVDYKTGSHPFNLDALEDGNDVQLPAYLFTAALPENKGVIGSEKEIVPASALFLSANETGGSVSPERSGFFLDDMDLLLAASSELDKKILAGIVIKDGKIQSGNAVSEEGIKEIDTTLRSAIANTGRDIFGGKASRTPSPSVCKFCYLRSGCPVAAKGDKF